MRLTLSPEQSQRWASGDPEAWQVEEEILTWADAQQITEPVVVVTATGQVAFAFTVGGDV
jgi:hypothetical protein